MKQYYVYEELKRRSYYDLYKICIDEKLVASFRENLDRVELINIILKYRSREKKYSIEKYKEYGIDRLQELFDTRLGYKLTESNSIKVPHQIVLYKEMPLTSEDDYKVSIPEHIGNSNVFLINGKNYLCGIFYLEMDIHEKNIYYLKTENKFLRLENLKNQNYSLLFLNKADEKFINESYYKEEGAILPLTLNYYEIPLDNLQYLELEKTDTPLCIDFGTANTTAGAYLDKYYVKNLPHNKILSGKLLLDKINYAKFPKDKNEYINVIPTIVYIKKCFTDEKIEYVFGHEVENKLKESGYNLRGSIFYGIKNWVKSLDQKERVVDENGDIRYVNRKVIIKAYIDYIVGRSESLFKCKFKNIHLTTPVKLKAEFIEMFKEILPEYEIIEKNALDEGVAVLYNSLEKIIQKNKFDENREYKALIIDCGGGTTDLASCIFKISSEDIFYNVEIKTTFENSEESFGGNNITYRIMQYLKIVLSQYYSDKKIENINDLIKTTTELIFREIDENGIKNIYKEFDAKYLEAETVIPTQFSNFENKASDMYSKVKNNFFFMWEIAELLKKELFKKTTIVRTKFDSARFESTDISHTYVSNWNLHIKDGENLKKISSYPNIVINKNEIIKLIKGDIYEIFRRFLTQYYETGVLYDYSLIKLSGQTCKVNIFNEILKEFVPGKMIDFGRNTAEEDQQLKISCVDGAISFLNSSKIGQMRVSVENDIPIVPYSLHGKKYTGEEIEIFRTGEQAGTSYGSIKKISTTEILPLYLKNKEQEIKKSFNYMNKKETYIEEDEQSILKFLNSTRVDLVKEEEKWIIKYKGQNQKIIRYEQGDLDDILNGETKFYIYTDSNYWGFTVVGVKREDDQLYLGKNEYYSFEEDMTTISFFDGKH